MSFQQLVEFKHACNCMIFKKRLLPVFNITYLNKVNFQLIQEVKYTQSFLNSDGPRDHFIEGHSPGVRILFK